MAVNARSGSALHDILTPLMTFYWHRLCSLVVPTKKIMTWKYLRTRQHALLIIFTTSVGLTL
jgi:hypothetical protein